MLPTTLRRCGTSGDLRPISRSCGDDANPTESIGNRQAYLYTFVSDRRYNTPMCYRILALQQALFPRSVRGYDSRLYGFTVCPPPVPSSVCLLCRLIVTKTKL